MRAVGLSDHLGALPQRILHEGPEFFRNLCRWVAREHRTHWTVEVQEYGLGTAKDRSRGFAGHGVRVRLMVPQTLSNQVRAWSTYCEPVARSLSVTE
ncbi:hypothetical protein GCM10009742_24720 [Kribbella karoonensis]|uniref:Uncharacterized protein n=1 Tax=Kribbella karoonensis TaxID=324851 RepID=A0ABN2DKL8_9ACTN